MENKELEFKIRQLDQLVYQWKRFYVLYRKISKPGEASPKEEQEYAELATTFARIYMPIAARVGLRPQGESTVLAMVTDVPDAEAIRGLSDMQRRKLENDWRSNNTAMNQKLGELQLLREELADVTPFGYYARRFLAIPSVQWTLGASIIIILLGVFGFFNMLHNVLLELVRSVK